MTMAMRKSKMSKMKKMCLKRGLVDDDYKKRRDLSVHVALCSTQPTTNHISFLWSAVSACPPSASVRVPVTQTHADSQVCDWSESLIALWRGREEGGALPKNGSRDTLPI